MALGLQSRLKSYLPSKLLKRNRKSTDSSISRAKSDVKVSTSPATPEETEKIINHEPSTTEKSRFDEQRDSSFFQKLPLELRKMIYAYVWQGPYDHMYHESNGRHVHLKEGRWVHTRCVMFPDDDEKTDTIQRNMDQIHYSGKGDLLIWQRRLASTWGHRHWRCEERLAYGKPTLIDRTDLGALMVVCKKMHPEVMQSYLETHKFILNDLYSAHRFLVQQPKYRQGASTVDPIRHIRDLDLTLSVPFHELAPFMTIGPPETEDDELHVAQEEYPRAQNQSQDTAYTNTTRLGAILAAVADRTTCLHRLRVSLDVYDRGPWRKIPETALAPLLERIQVRKSKDGEINYTVELPPALPIRTHYAGMRYLDLEDEGEEEKDSKNNHGKPFRVVRRPALRYWQFNPGEVEHFTWETYNGEKQTRHCWIALSKASRFISNPYLIDFSER